MFSYIPICACKKSCTREKALLFLQGYWRSIRNALHTVGGFNTVFVGEAPVAKQALILATHESLLDTIVFHELERPAYIAKSELFKIPFFGACMKKVGMIPIVRDNPTPSDGLTLLRDIKKAFEDNRQVILFPEGTRTHPDKHRKIQPGVSMIIKIALKKKVPIIPVSISSYHVWKPSMRSMHNKELVVTFGNPLSHEELSLLNKKDLINFVSKALFNIY